MPRRRAENSRLIRKRFEIYRPNPERTASGVVPTLRIVKAALVALLVLAVDEIRGIWKAEKIGDNESPAARHGRPGGRCACVYKTWRQRRRRGVLLIIFGGSVDDAVGKAGD